MKTKILIIQISCLIVMLLFITGCAGQTAAAPTALPTAPATAAPTAVPFVDITKPVKVDGAELKFVLATDDTSLYDSGPFTVQHADDVTVLHVAAEIVSGNLDLETFQDGIALFDENGEDLAMVSYSTEKPFWEFLAPLASKSFILQLPDGQLVKLDPILNLLADGASGAAARPTAANTPIPPTPEPSILIQLGPGKFGKAMWLDVIKGDYQIVGGSTLRTGSSIGVNEDWLNFPPGLAIDIVGTTVTLKGTTYPDGSKLRVDQAGNLVSRDAGANSAAAEPNPLSAPTQALHPILTMLYQDTFAHMAENFDVKLELIEAGFLSMDGGKTHTEMSMKVRCMTDAACSDKMIYIWALMIIQDHESMPNNLETFNVQVLDQQDQVRVNVSGSWSDLMEYADQKISEEELKPRLKFSDDAGDTSDAVAPPAQTQDSIIGKWQRSNTDYYEELTFFDDGTYTVEAKENGTNTVMGSNSGKFSYDEITINYVDKSKIAFSETYSLGQDGQSLIINNAADKPWKRAQ
ncbi:MAG: hypothetical protein AB9891_01560 [Anaerolineaceae bacterium]